MYSVRQKDGARSISRPCLRFMCSEESQKGSGQEMITFDQAVNSKEFHFRECKITIGPRGGQKISREIWRRNGMTQTWKTRPGEFRIPVKFGLNKCNQIWHYDADKFHAAEDCRPVEYPLQKILEIIAES